MKFSYCSVWIFFSFFYSVCSAQENCNNCGVVLSTFRVYDQQKQEFVMPTYFKDRRMWYKDSMVIAENMGVNIWSDSNGREKWEAYTKSYTFIDLQTQSFYVYSSFSDTARLIKKYAQPDTGTVEGGWNFFNKKGAFLYGNKQFLSDTIIKGIVYKRIMAYGYVKDGDTDVKNTQVAYLRCDLNNSFFYVDMPISKQTGCPVVRFDHIAEDRIWTKIEFEFLPDKLTPREIQVFNAWERNAKQNPVK